MMRTSYDPEADAMFVWFAPEGMTSADTREVAPGIMLDFDAAGAVIGIEILDVRARGLRPNEQVGMGAQAEIVMTLGERRPGTRF